MSDWAEEFRLAGEDWADKDAAANLLEESKSAFLSQSMAEYGGEMAVSRAEALVKAGSPWADYIEQMVEARKLANHAKVKMEYLRMRYHEQQAKDATARAEMRMG